VAFDHHDPPPATVTFFDSSNLFASEKEVQGETIRARALQKRQGIFVYIVKTRGNRARAE
jgi:hypothetical protein